MTLRSCSGPLSGQRGTTVRSIDLSDGPGESVNSTRVESRVERAPTTRDRSGHGLLSVPIMYLLHESVGVADIVITCPLLR